MKSNYLIMSTLLACFALPAKAQTCVDWFDFNSDATTKMTTMKVPSTNQFDLTGQLIRRPLLVTDKYYWVGYQLHNSVAMMDQQAGQSLEYSVPFAAKIDKASGRVIKYHFAAKLKAADESKLIAIHQALYITPKPVNAAGQPSYVMVEADDLGTYEVHYQEQSAQTVIRKKLQYTAVADAASSSTAIMKLQTPRVLSDEFRFNQDACWHHSVTGSSHIFVETTDKNMQIEVQQQVNLKKRLDALPLSARLLSLDEDPMNWRLISQDTIYPREPAKPLASEEAFITAIQLMDWKKGESETLLQFLYDNDQYLSVLNDLLLNQVFSDDDESKLFMYLGKHDSKNSQQLLTQVFMNEAMSGNQRFRSLMGLKYSEREIDGHIIVDLMNYATDQHQQENLTLSSTALMVLGAVAKNQPNSLTASIINEQLVDALQAKDLAQTKVALLAALGNSGNDENEEVVAEYLHSTNPRLRAEAAAALAKLPNSNSAERISAQLRGESDRRVQSVFIEAMAQSKLNEAQLNQVHQFASNADNRELRSVAIGALAKQMTYSKSVEPVLKELLKTEKNKRNLSQIMKALYGQ